MVLTCSLSSPQSVWIREELLERLHCERMRMARMSMQGYQEAFGDYQSSFFLVNTPTGVCANTLAQAYEQYQLLLAERENRVDNVELSCMGGPFQMCPACFKRPKGGAYDCVFKTKRFKAAGGGDGEPLQPTGVFNVEQETVDQYVERGSAAKPIGEKSDCSSQFAADDDRAKRSGHYDLQAIGAFVCRHYFIISAVILHYGERYGYLLAILRFILTMAAQYNVVLSDLFTVSYDVACKAGPYAIKHGDIDAMRHLQYVTGKLHGKVHEMKCQLTTNCLYRKGAGLSSGEQCEIVWAHTTQGAPIAKYMSPLNWMRFYARHFRFWNQRQRENLPGRLVTLAKRAVEKKNAAESALRPAYIDLYNEEPEPATPLTSKYSSAFAELKAIVCEPTATGDASKADVEYACLLSQYYEEQSKVFAPHVLSSFGGCFSS